MQPGERADHLGLGNVIQHVAAVVLVRRLWSWTPANIGRGSVRWPGPAISSATTTSSNDAANAKMAPDSTPGKISGNIPRRKVVSGGEPRLAAALSSVRSKP